MNAHFMFVKLLLFDCFSTKRLICVHVLKNDRFKVLNFVDYISLHYPVSVPFVWFE